MQYGQISAPVAGIVTERSAEPGGRVSSGQQLLMIVETDDLWVTANFKETQLAHMRPGQRVTVYVDALRERLFSEGGEHAGCHWFPHECASSGKRHWKLRESNSANAGADSLRRRPEGSR